MTASYCPVVAIGELLWDLLPSGKVLGGAPANFAFRLSTLGTAACLVSRVGADPLGDAAVQELHAHGMDTSLIQRDPVHSTGTVDVVLASDGAPSFTINANAAYDYLEVTEQLTSTVRQAKLICYGTLLQRATTARQSLYTLLSEARNALKLLDINLRKDCYCLNTIKASLDFADILKLNEEELLQMAAMLNLKGQGLEELARGLINKFELQSCLVTRAENGVFAIAANGERIDLPGHKVEVVDTVGSGDAFTAGFVISYLQGAGLRSACERGNRLGAMVAATKGGMTFISQSELEQFSAL